MPKSDTPKRVMHDVIICLFGPRAIPKRDALFECGPGIALFRSFELGLCWPLAFLSRIRGHFAELLLPLLHHEMILTSVF